MNKYCNSVIQNDLRELEKKIDYEKLNGKKFFITGSTGMLAAYIVYFLIYLNENIDNFHCKIFLAVRNIEKAKKRFGKYIEKDYFNIYKDNLEKKIVLKENIDFIIHAASIAQTKYFKDNPIDVIIPNTIILKNLLDFSKEKCVESFLFFSSCSVYGKVKEEKEIDENTFGILNPLDINSCYSESKRLGETLCRAYYIQKNVNTKIARISHTYGPTMDLESDDRVFSEFVKNILDFKDIILKSDGKAVRSFLYILDATEAFFKILLDKNGGEVYNVANPYENISILLLAERLIKKFSNRNISLKYEKRNENYLENKFDNRDIFSIQKIFYQTGWKPSISIEEGFERTVRSFEEK